MAEVKTPIGDAPVIPLIILMTGLYLAWFGIHYWRTDVKYPSTPVKDVLQGNGLTGSSKPATLQATLLSDVQAASATGSTGTTQDTTGNAASSGGKTGSAIADDALKYVGHAYLFGGAPGPDGKLPWDCSSFVNYVIGHDMGMQIPGGSWKTVTNNGSSHGPATTSWLLFGQAINRKDVKAGDIAVSANHMGIAVSNSDMVSALNPSLGTKRSPIEGYFPDPTVHFRRISG